MKFIITIDTEADNQWTSDNSNSCENIKFIPRFQDLCEQYNFQPVYLTSYEILNNQYYIDFIKDCITKNTAEIGVHLHPWSCPPFEKFDKTNSSYKYYPSELPIDLFEKKINILTQKIINTCQIQPISYRAGRWGFASDHIDILLKYGYLVDSSVTPYINWKNTKGLPDGKGGPDYRTAPNKDFFLNEQNICIPGTSCLLEIPVTVLFVYFKFLKDLFLNTNSCQVKRFLTIINAQPQWLRPLPYISLNTLKKIYIQSKLQKLPYLHMMIHSSELMPGGSPYNPNKNSIEKFYTKLEDFFIFIKQKGLEGITLKDYSLLIKNIES